ALYGYFAGKDDLLLALAADDLTMLARAMRDAVSGQPNDERLSAAATVALAALAESETIAAALTALPSGEAPNEAERLFNGRMIAALKVLSDASGSTVASREGQCDVVLAASAVAGLALLARSGRLEALGFSTDEILKRLEARFQA
ncbi:MAG: hypothetical protein JO167_13805, partial [Alphaproteobacteria bacterium]|nr:hypothetical protein [Alphaproteobacteria bacterium]